MKKYSSSGWILLLIVFAQGCVTASTHEKLQKDYDGVSSELSSCKEKYTFDEKRIFDDQDKIRDLNILVNDLKSKLGSTSSDKFKLEGNVAEMKAALEALTRQRADAEQRIQEFRDFLKKFKSLTDTGKITVKIIDGQMVVTLASDVLFPSGSAHLSKAGIDAIKEVTSLLTSVSGRKYQIQGFTDNVPIKTALFPSNWELSSARALTVVKTMLEAGMPPEQVSAAGFGDTHPVSPNDTDEGRSANRRIQIVVVPDLSTLPGYDQLQKMAGS